MFKVLQAFVPFLDQERYDLVRFFEFFLSKSPQKATAALTEVQDKLALSSYKLQETILAVQSICDELPELQLSQSKNKYLTLSGLDTLKLKKIILHEAKDSLRFKIFVHISLNPAGWSDTEFQKKCGISRSTYFRIKCSLLTDLGSKKTTMLVSSEAYSRYYIYSVLYYFSFFDFIEHSSGKKKITESLNYLTFLLKLSPTNIQHKQHLYFSAVSYWRSKTGHKLSDEDSAYFVDIKSTPDIKRFTHYFNKSWKMTNSSAYRCVRFFTTFQLLIEGIDAKRLPFLREYPLIEELTQLQLKAIRESIRPNFCLSDDSPLTDKLLRINAKMLIPVFLNTSYNSMKDWAFYENSYLSTVQLTKKLIQIRRDFPHARPLRSDEYTQLYYSYLFTLLAEIPSSSFSDQVHIAVNFSQGLEYTDYIKKKLEEFLSLNVQVDNFVNPQTDIYITNSFDPAFKNVQVIWEHPPLTDDLVHLRELVVRIKNSKHRSKIKDQD